LHIFTRVIKRDNIEKAEIPSKVSRASFKTSLRIMGAEERTRRRAERTGHRYVTGWEKYAECKSASAFSVVLSVIATWKW
jgi:hypothetical protein